MRKKRNQPQQQAKYRIAVWAAAHKESLQGLSLGEAHTPRERAAKFRVKLRLLCFWLRSK
jgi:hypothetical protein